MIVALPKVVKIPSPFFFFRVIPAPRNPLLEPRSTLEQIIVVIPFFEIRQNTLLLLLRDYFSRFNRLCRQTRSLLLDYFSREAIKHGCFFFLSHLARRYLFFIRETVFKFLLVVCMRAFFIRERHANFSLIYSNVYSFGAIYQETILNQKINKLHVDQITDFVIIRNISLFDKKFSIRMNRESGYFYEIFIMKIQFFSKRKFILSLCPVNNGESLCILNRIIK